MKLHQSVSSATFAFAALLSAVGATPDAHAQDAAAAAPTDVGASNVIFDREPSRAPAAAPANTALAGISTPRDIAEDYPAAVAAAPNAAAPDIAASVVPNAASSAVAAAATAYTALFNGANLDGWWGVTNWGGRGNDVNPRKYATLAPDSPELARMRAATAAAVAKHWRAENGELINDGSGPYLATLRNYGDFELIADYKTVPDADSGIYLRGHPQVQIWDSTKPGKTANGAERGSGALWNNTAEGRFPLNKADQPLGQWNRLRILLVGSRGWVWLNGKPTVCGAVLENYFDRKTPIVKEGPILLQTHGGEIRWRNLHIREIPPAAANAILAARAATDFAPLFDGKTLDNWTGATNAVEIKDNALVWLPGKGGVLHTKAEHANFVLRLEFQIPPGANNGLAIRYPGKGDAAFTGMCEIQILDDHYEKVRKAKIDPRQAHGSAYGKAAAARGYQRPYNEWNFEEVTVNGSTVRVELNGFVILDADLSKIPPQSFMHRRPHPGKDRATGFLGFTGHSDRLLFRNIHLRPLP